MRTFRVTVTTNYLFAASDPVARALDAVEKGQTHGPAMLEELMHQWENELRVILAPPIDGYVTDPTSPTEIQFSEVTISAAKPYKHPYTPPCPTIPKQKSN